MAEAKTLLPRFEGDEDETHPFVPWTMSAALLAGTFLLSSGGCGMAQSMFAGPGSETKNWLMTELSAEDNDLSTFLICLGVMAVAGCGAIYYFSDWIKHLEGPESMFKNWQVATCAAFVVSNIFASIPITLLGTPGTIVMQEIDKPRSMLTAAPWAWVIAYNCLTYGQYIFICFQALPTEKTNTLLAEAAPYYMAALLFYPLWCWSFCAYAKQLLWVSTIFMIGVPFCLNGAHKAISANPKVYKSWPTLFFAQIPLALHMGWTTISALNSANKALARIEYPLYYQIAFGFFGIYFAFSQGNTLMPERKCLILGLTLAFGILAIGHGTQLCFEDKHPRWGCLAQLIPSKDENILQAQWITAVFLGASVIINAISLARDMFAQLAMG